jgi:hypothetical protein
MADRATNSNHGYGLSGLTQGGSFTDYETKLSKDLDKYLPLSNLWNRHLNGKIFHITVSLLLG